MRERIDENDCAKKRTPSMQGRRAASLPAAASSLRAPYHNIPFIQTDRQTDRRHYTLPPALPLSQLSLLPTRCEARAETAKTVILFAPLPLFNHRVMRGPKHRREQADQRNFTPHESERPAGRPADGRGSCPTRRCCRL